MDNWVKVERGIRYREHPTRRHGVPRRPDRYYVIKLAVDGVMRQEALGWESEGITLEKARVELAKLREAKRTGKGPRSLASEFDDLCQSREIAYIRNVTFEPGCRNFWHTHIKGGQILLVTAGRGWYQEWGKPAKELHPGDVVNIPQGTKHWHGAAKDSWFSHVSVIVPAEEAPIEWLEPVSEEYNRLT